MEGTSGCTFDGKRMILGGFEPILAYRKGRSMGDLRQKKDRPCGRACCLAGVAGGQAMRVLENCFECDRGQ